MMLILYSDVDIGSLHIQSIHKKRPAICGFLNDFGRQFASAVTCLCLDPDQDGSLACLWALGLGTRLATGFLSADV